MENSKRLKEEVEKRFRELEEYTNAFNEKATSDRRKYIEDNKLKFKEESEEVDISTIAKEYFYLNGFHQMDVRILQTEFLSAYTIYKKVFSGEELSKDIESTAKILKGSIQRQFFTLEGGEFKELEEGRKDKALKDFEDRNYFKIFEKQIKQALDE